MAAAVSSTAIYRRHATSATAAAAAAGRDPFRGRQSFASRGHSTFVRLLPPVCADVLQRTLAPHTDARSGTLHVSRRTYINNNGDNNNNNNKLLRTVRPPRSTACRTTCCRSPQRGQFSTGFPVLRHNRLLTVTGTAAVAPEKHGRPGDPRPWRAAVFAHYSSMSVKRNIILYNNDNNYIILRIFKIISYIIII